MNVLKRLIFWDFARGSWQYDIVVVLILAFIFLTPRSVFRDQPQEARVELLLADPAIYMIDARLLRGVQETDHVRIASEAVRKRFGPKASVSRIERIVDADSEITGYKAYAQP